jgi:hypothetical protein
MIFVTGTKRSGTSMWMQILIEAGFSYIGEPYPKNWLNSIGQANKEGFYESPLRRGVFHATNPHPKTGAYLFPGKTQKHVIKVFIPGLVYSDVAFIHRVVGTIRPWREYVSSLQRLYDMEDEYLAEKPKQENHPLDPLQMARLQRGNLDPALEWWRENYDLIRNFVTRRFPFNLVSYRKLLEAPSEVIPPVIKWCGGGDIEKAIAAVKPNLNTQRDTVVIDTPVSDKQQQIFDEFHEFFYQQTPLTGSFITKLNELDSVLAPLIKEQRKHDLIALRKAFMLAGVGEKEADQLATQAQEKQQGMGF